MPAWTSKQRRAVWALGVAAIAFGPAQAFAQDNRSKPPASQDEIVVTATKRTENIQDVPLSVTAIGGEFLETTGARELSDFVAKAPGLSLRRSNRSSNDLSIRGLTSLAGTVSEFPMVGAYVDEVPISENSIPDIGLLDLERIEVLRGPQGTLYGEGSMGGTVRFITRKPNLDAIGGNAQVEVSSTRDGGTNELASGAINLPLASDRAALRIAGFYEDNAGFVDNAANGKKNADAYTRSGLRATLLVKPTSRLSLSLMGAYQKFDGGIEPNVFLRNTPGLTPPRLTKFGDTIAYRQADTYSDDEIYLANGLINWDLGFGTLTSSTSYYNRDSSGAQDESQTARIVEAGFSPLTQALGLGPLVLTKGVQTKSDGPNETFSQEVRLSSNGETRLRYTVGGYFRTRDISFSNDTRAPDLIGLNQILLSVPPALGGPLSSNPTYAGELQIARAAVNYRQGAVFGEATYAATDKLDVTAGLRYSSERVRGNQALRAPNFALGPGFLTLFSSNFPTLEQKESKLLWKLNASYKPSDDILVYAQAATGLRPGGVNARANPTPGADSPVTFRSDSVTSYEIGAKTEWYDGKLTANFAAYTSKLDQVQFIDVRDTLFPVIRNASGADASGVELELTARPTPNFTFGASLSAQDAHFSGNALPFVQGGKTIFIVQDGQKLPAARDFSGNAYVEWRHPLSETLTLVTYADVSKVTGAPLNTVRPETGAVGTSYNLKGYTTGNAQIGVETGRYTVTLFVNNVTDEFAELGGSEAFGLSRNTPRTVGLRARLSY